MATDFDSLLAEATAAPVEGTGVGRDADRLRAVHERIRATGPVSVRLRQFWLRAVKS